MLLLRHGQSEFNAVFTKTRVDPLIPDPPLTEEGRAQALAAARALAGAGVRRLISSPYRRALQTAAILSHALEIAVEIEPLVRERAAFHCDIGSSPATLAAGFPGWRFEHLDDPWWHDHVRLGAPESEEALSARAERFRDAMAHAPLREETLVVTHWGFIRALAGQAVGNCETVRLAR